MDLKLCHLPGQIVPRIPHDAGQSGPALGFELHRDGGNGFVLRDGKDDMTFDVIEICETALLCAELDAYRHIELRPRELRPPQGSWYRLHDQVVTVQNVEEPRLRSGQRSQNILSTAWSYKEQLLSDGAQMGRSDPGRTLQAGSLD